MKPVLPSLDTHAHIAPDISPVQAQQLGHSFTFAMTRSLDEASHVRGHPSRAMLWGLGSHPGSKKARDDYEEKRFSELLHSFALVGEVGLDKRGGDPKRQREIFRSMLRVCSDEPVLLSIHSSGRSSEVLELLAESHQRGPILHWWSSEGSELAAAIDLGCYFSVNTAMDIAILRQIPPDRLLTETDFPARTVRASKPGDIGGIESLLSDILDLPTELVRHKMWSNLRDLARNSGAMDRLPIHALEAMRLI